MNIFIYDLDFEKNAQMHCDRHVVKMATEYNQILSTVCWMNGETAPYKPTHQHHPSVKWCSESKHNYEFLVSLNKALCKEYTYRYGKIHAGEIVLMQLDNTYPNLPDRGITPFALAMPDIYKHKNPITAYRAYFNGEKLHLAKWKNRNIPEWVKIQGGM